MNHVLLSFFFNDTATTEIYTLSLHDALPISPGRPCVRRTPPVSPVTDCSSLQTREATTRTSSRETASETGGHRDRKSTRLNSSHANISYAVFCLKKQKDSPCTRGPPNRRLQH